MFCFFSVCSVLSVCSVITLYLFLRDPRLKVQPQAELPFPHLCQRCDTEDLPGGGGIHRAVRLSQIDVIEGVVKFGPELSFESFSDPEVLAQGRIVVEEPRPEERIARHCAERSCRRSLPGAARATVRIQLRGWSSGCDAARPAGSRRGGGEPTFRAGIGHARVANQIRAVRPRICVTPKVSVRGRERQTGSPEGDARELPAADQVVNRT